MSSRPVTYVVPLETEDEGPPFTASPEKCSALSSGSSSKEETERLRAMVEFSQSTQVPLLEVKGFPPGTGREIVKHFFSCARQSGGGFIRDLDFQEGNQAVILFHNKNVAQRVLSKQPLQFAGATLSVRAYIRQEQTTTTTEDDEKSTPIQIDAGKSSNSRPTYEASLPEELASLFPVYGMYPKTTECLLSLLQNEEVQVSDDHVFLMFENKEGARKVLGKEPLSFRDTTLRCRSVQGWFQSQTSPYQKLSSSTVDVAGVSLVSESFVQGFFENGELSGGGPIEKILNRPATDLMTIKFKNSEDAEEVLKRGTYMVGTQSWLVIPFEEFDDPEPCTVEVRGFKLDTPPQFINLFFNSQECNGGEVTRLEYERGDEVALVTFAKPEVASRVLQENSLELDGERLEIRRHFTKRACRHCTDISQRLDTVRVEGIPPDLPPDYVELFFENTLKSGGGPIRNIHLEESTALITFKEPRYAVQVVKENPRIRNEEMKISLLDTAPDISPKTCALEVRDIDDSISEERLTLYFESARRSGGGDIDEVAFDNNRRTAVLTFQKPEVVDRLLAKERLSLDNHEFTVGRMKPGPYPPFPVAPTDPNLVLMRHVSTNCTSEDLIAFATRHGKRTVENVQYGLQPGLALIEFHDIPDYDGLRLTCMRRPLRGAMMRTQKVKKSTAIQVFNVQDTQIPRVKEYFENEQDSGGGPCDFIVRPDGFDCVVIVFEDQPTMERVLQKAEHKVDDEQLDVRCFHEELGILPLGYDTSTPTACIPTSIDYPVDSSILEFWMRSMSIRQSIEEKMELLHCRVDWPCKCKDPLRLTCQLKPQMPRIQTLVSEWEENVRKNMESFGNRFSQRSVQTLQKVWGVFLTNIGDFTSGDNNLLDAEIDHQLCKIKLVGLTDAVKEKHAQLKTVLKQTIQEVKLKENIISECLNDLSEVEMKLLVVHDVPDIVMSNFQHLKFTIREGDVLIEGLIEDIMKVQRSVYQFISQAKAMFFPLTPGRRALIEKTAVEEALTKKLRERKLGVVWELVEDGIKVFSNEEDQLISGLSLIDKSLLEKQINVAALSARILQENAWKRFYNEVNHTHSLACVQAPDREKQIVVSATEDIFQKVCEQLSAFLKEHEIHESLLAVSPAEGRFLQKHMQAELEQIQCAVNKEVHVEVVCSERGNYVRLEGTRSKSNKALNDVSSLRQNLVRSNHEVTKFGARKLLGSPEGNNFLESLEAQMRATVELVDSTQMINTPGCSLPAQARASVKFQSATLMVVKADLPSYQTDGIVNAANKELRLLGGLAGAILKAGGASIQKECDDFIQRRGKLTAGEVYTSLPGNLPCQKIIHAVGPEWEGGDSSEREKLSNAVRESLLAARDNGLQSIAIPPISSGIYGYPLDESCRVIIEAVVNFFMTGNRSPTEVHFVSNDERSTKAFHRALQKFEGCGRPGDSFSAGGGGTPARQVHFLAAGENVVKTIKGNLRLRLVLGCIEQQQVDVLVNTTSKDFNLATGAVSAAIVSAAGSSIQEEIKAAVPNGGQPGELVVTSGGSLPCANIYHGYLADWNGPTGSAQKILRTFLRACFARACRDQKKSMALPPLGTGNLNCPPDQMMDILLEEIAQCSETDINSTLGDIHLVVMKQDTEKVSVFKEALKKWSSHDHYDDGSEETATPSNSEEATLTREQFSIGPVKVLVRHGDITKETTDAIVNSTNNSLGLNGPLSRAIVKEGGDDISKACTTLGHTEKGIAVTTAGKLKASYVIHVSLDEGGDDPGSWQKIIQRALVQAEKMGLESIALPALGTGKAGKSTEQIAHVMFSALKSFVMEENPAKLTRVHVIVFNHDTLTVFTDKLSEITNVTSGSRENWDTGCSGRKWKPAVVQVLALTHNVTNEVVKRVEDYCKKETREIVVDGPEYQSCITLLPVEQVRLIKSLQREEVLEVTVDQSENLSRIHIQGQTQCVWEAYQNVVNILQEVNAAIKLKSMVQWTYRDANSTSCDYPLLLNKQIEDASVKRQPDFRWEDGDKKYRIVFSSMEQELIGNPGNVCDIQRIGLGEANLPVRWEEMSEDENLKLASNLSLDEERGITNKFKETFGSLSYTIEKIQRVQNKKLYLQYVTSRDLMSRANPSVKKAERLLWHGTDADAVPNIYGHGFNRSYCGKNATMYGKGAYFATTSAYSQRYSVPDSQRLKYMFRCRVLTGRFTNGNSELIEPPEIDDRPGHRYDSVVDNPGNPSIFVIFKDTHAYPDYLITFRVK